MKLEKAIEIKTDYVEHLPLGVNADWINADRLSIEAVKRRKYISEYTSRWADIPLPGETED